jgi:hypothetical protein
VALALVHGHQLPRVKKNPLVERVAVSGLFDEIKVEQRCFCLGEEGAHVLHQLVSIQPPPDPLQFIQQNMAEFTVRSCICARVRVGASVKVT